MEPFKKGDAYWTACFVLQNHDPAIIWKADLYLYELQQIPKGY